MNNKDVFSVETDLSHGFSDRLAEFQSHLGFSNPEGAKMAGITYNAYTRWRGATNKLPSKPVDIQRLVVNAYRTYRSDLLNSVAQTLAWLCFGIEDLNPFVGYRLDKGSLADCCIDVLNIYENIAASDDVDSSRITDKKRSLAIKKIVSSSCSFTGGSLSDDDVAFIKDILNL